MRPGLPRSTTAYLSESSGPGSESERRRGSVSRTIRARSDWAFGRRSADHNVEIGAEKPTRVMAPGARPGAITANRTVGVTSPSCPSCPSSCWPIWSPHGGSNPHSVGPCDSVSCHPNYGRQQVADTTWSSCMVCEIPRYALSGSRVPGQRQGFDLTSRSPRPETVCRDSPILQAFTHSR